MNTKKLRKLGSYLTMFILVCTFCLGLSMSAPAAEPVDITYGYHPYWTGGWTGVVIKQRELWKKYLPEGSEVNFQAHLTGPPMVNALLADKMQIGTMGDMPSLVAITKKSQGDIRLVSTPMISLGQNCNLVVVRDDAPDFDSPEEAIKWLNGKNVAVHRGTCANRFFEAALDKYDVNPKKLQYMGVEVISSSFEAGKIDGAAMWEPHARKVVEHGHAKYAATGAPYDELDANFSLMRQDFIEEHPEAAKGWMKAEIEALQIMRDNPRAVAEMVAQETQGYDENVLWKALYAKHPDSVGGSDIVYTGEMLFTDRVMELMQKGFDFLHRIDVLNTDKIPENAINDGPVKAAMKEMDEEVPVIEIVGSPESEIPF